jgi:hypothetical protein
MKMYGLQDINDDDIPGSPQEWEKILVRKIQKGNASVDLNGDVYSTAGEFPNTYLGRLRRKAIPNRRKLEQDARDAKKAEKPQELGDIVRDGIPPSEMGFPWNSRRPNWWKGQF